MGEKIYKITLANGLVISNLKLNGNNFISEESIDPAIFKGNCSPVVINDGFDDEIHNYMDLVQVTVDTVGNHWFVLRDVSEEELDRVKMQSDIEYVAMMAGVEL